MKNDERIRELVSRTHQMTGDYVGLTDTNACAATDRILEDILKDARLIDVLFAENFGFSKTRYAKNLKDIASFHYDKFLSDEEAEQILAESIYDLPGWTFSDYIDALDTYFAE